MPEHYQNLSVFHKLLLVKCFRKEKVIFSITNYVLETLGENFIQIKPTSLSKIFKNETTCRVPIIFVLSVGADPTSLMYRLAEKMEFSEKLDIISLGKGQGDRAKAHIKKAIEEGRWVVL